MKRFITILVLMIYSGASNAQLGDLFRKLGAIVDSIPSAPRENQNSERNAVKPDSSVQDLPSKSNTESNSGVGNISPSPSQIQFRSSIERRSEPDSVNRVQSGTQNQEKVLLSEAISLIQNLSPDLASKDRLKIYENALQKFDTIIDEYGHTDTGLTLKSTGRFGNFDYNVIQQRYGAELTSFYMKTCEVSPSAICQGFVSLKDGVDSCKTANSFNELRTAHLNIINSMIIFGEQEKNPGLYKHAKMNYYACKKRASDVNEDAARDYFNYQLVKTILPMNDGGSARGLVENMKNPFYKFASVIELKKYSGDTVDTAYISRMMKYIDDTMPEQRGANINYLRVSSILSLLNIAHLPESKFRLNLQEYGERNSLSNKLRFKLIAVQNSSGRDVMLRSNSCQDPIFSREIFDSSFEYLDKLYTSYNQNPDMSYIRSNNIKYFIEADFASRTGDGDSFEVPIFNGCSEKYSIALSAISALFYENKPNEARKYYLQFTNGNFSNDKLKLIDEYLTLSSFNNNYGRRAMDDMTKESLFKMPFMMTGQDGNFSLFKKYVDNNLICEASSVLFKEMKNSKHTVSARSYLTAKNKLARGNKIKCGDEDLELLLR
jgi:hypothetical protein